MQKVSFWDQSGQPVWILGTRCGAVKQGNGVQDFKVAWFDDEQDAENLCNLEALPS
jgi:hypothetical protein